MAAKVEKPEVMDQRFIDGTTVCIEDTELKYPHLINRDTEMDGDWNVNCKLTREAAVAMKKIGFNVKEDTGDGTYWIQVKKIHTTRSGQVNNPPKIYMKDTGEVVTEEPGHGTKADVHLWCKYTKPIKGKIYMSAYISEVAITHLEKREAVAKVTF